jgi:sugar phosphate isomerase/epimerase
VRPEECFDRIVVALRHLADQAAAQDLIIGIENEHACNIGTGAEAARLLKALDHPNLKLVWDPANAVVGGEKAIPDGYSKLPVSRIQHVHAKDCTMDGHKPNWCRIGDGVVGWRDQMDALIRDGYKGWISLETHWPGPGGNKHEASMICGRALKELVG